MSVEFVVGRPSGSADAYVNSRIIDILKKDPAAPVYVVTPRQSTFGVEEELFRADGLEGHLGLEVTSPQRLAGSVLDQVYGGAGEPVDNAGKSMAVRRIMDRHRDDLRAFARIAAGAGLPARITEQIGRIRSMDVSPEELAEYGEKTGNARFHDLAVVYGMLDEELGGRMDVDARMDAAIEHLEEAWFLREAELVVVRGFPSFTSQQVRFVEALMRTAPNTIVLFPGAPEGAPDEEVYRASQAALRQLQNVPLQMHDLTVRRISDPQDMQAPEDILHASHYLFSHGHRPKLPEAPSMTIGEAADPEQEIRAAAAEIVRLHLEQDTAFSDMAVVWGDTDVYEPLIRRIFQEAHIPYFTGEQKTLADSNLAEFILTAAEIAMGDLRKDALVAHAATGFTALSAYEQGLLQNYAFSEVSWGRQFEKPFRLKESSSFRDDAQAAETARQRLMGPILEYLRKPLNNGRIRDAGAVFRAVEAYLEAVLTEEAVAARAVQLGDSYEQASFLEQTYRSAAAIVRQAAQMLEGTELRPGEARRILEAGFQAVRLSLVPAGVDEVQAGHLDRTYVPEVDTLFVLGINDEVLPRFAETSRDILTTREWTSLLQDVRGIEVPSNTDEQKFYLVRAVRQARRRIHWSYHVSGGQRPSMIVSYLDNLFEKPVPRADLAGRSAYLKQNAFDAALRQVRAAADGAPVDPDPAFLAGALFDEEFAGRLNRLRTSLAPAEEPAPAPALRVPKSMSTSRLSAYYSCPYKHFLKYQLGVWEPDSSDMDSRDAGTYVHGVLERVSRKMREKEDDPSAQIVKWSDLPEMEFGQVVEEAVRETRTEQIGTEPYARTEAALQVLDRQVRRTASQLRDQYANGELAPYGSEFPFYLPESGLTGVIDRIDAVRMAETGKLYYSVVDYKSGSRDFLLEDVMSGTNMQLTIYLMALEELIRSGQIEPGELAGAGYLQVLLNAARERSPKWWLNFRMQGLLAVPEDVASSLYGRDASSSTYDSLHNMKMLVSKRASRYESRASAGHVFLPAGTDPATGLGRGGDFGALMQCARDLTAGARVQMQNGDNRILPYRSGDALACEHCSYRSICGFDEAQRGMHARSLETTSASGLRDILMETYGTAGDREEV